MPERSLKGPRYESALQRAANRDYPRALQQLDAALYSKLGLSGRADLVPRAAGSKVWYDPAARSLLVRRATTPQRAPMINELVRALVDQNFNLHRLAGLRARDRDRALAAQGIVDGTAALASGLHPSTVRGTPLTRFLQLDSGLAPGKALAKELHYLGGRRALATALRTFPQTTEQLLHVDKFLEREPALRVLLPKQVADLKLQSSETFGELDVRSLLASYRVPGANAVAGGWGGGRLALYVSPIGESTAVLALRWDSYEDAVEWRDAIAAYVAAAFPGVAPSNCPPLDHCWAGPTSLAAGTIGETSLFASGPGATALAAAALAAN